MTTSTGSQLADLVQRLLAVEGAELTLSATVDLSVDSTGQPPTLKALDQAVDQAIQRARITGSRERAALEVEGRSLIDAAQEASRNGSLGLIYNGIVDRDLDVVELATPVRTSVHAGPYPWVFDIVRADYLNRPVSLVSADLHTMEVTRVHFGVAEQKTGVDWDAHYLSKRGGRTNQSGRSGAGAGGGAGGGAAGGGGHSYQRIQSYVEHQRSLFAAEAAEQLAQAVHPEDLLVVAGVDEARAQILQRLPDSIAPEGIVQRQALEPNIPERDLLAMLREIATRAQFERAARHVDEWFSGAHRDLALGGLRAIHDASEQGRVGTLILHEDAVDHFGTWQDARLNEPPGDAAAVERALQAALRQGAEVLFTDDPRVLQQHEGAIAVARYSL